jgi:choline transport protein
MLTWGSWSGVCYPQLVCALCDLPSESLLMYSSWTAMATSLSLALPSGGPTAVIWGIAPSFIGNLAMAASMAEM